MMDEVCGGGGLPVSISCYRVMTQGSYYHGSGFLLLYLVGLVVRGQETDVIGRGKSWLSG